MAFFKQKKTVRMHIICIGMMESGVLQSHIKS